MYPVAQVVQAETVEQAVQWMLTAVQERQLTPSW